MAPWTSIGRPIHEGFAPDRFAATRARLTFSSVNRQRAVEVTAGAIDIDIEGIEGGAAVAERVPHAELVQTDAVPLPFPDRAFERLFTGHFYGHLEEPDRAAFLEEARRVADELVLVDSSQAHSPVAVEWQPRVLNDGSEWEVYKRYFTGEGLAAELGGGEVLHEGRWFVVVRSRA